MAQLGVRSALSLCGSYLNPLTLDKYSPIINEIRFTLLIPVLKSGD